MPYFLLPIRITESNRKQKRIRKYFRGIYQYESAFYSASDNNREALEYLEKDLARHERYLASLSQRPRWEQLFGFAAFIEQVTYRNAISEYLLDIYAPKFFKTFPKGEIWFVPIDTNYLSLADRRLEPIAKQLGPMMMGTRTVPLFATGVSLFDYPLTIALSLHMTLRYPNVQGVVKEIYNGFLLFLIDPPIDSQSGDMSLREMLRSPLFGVYNDLLSEAGHSLRIRRAPLPFPKFRSFLDRYINWLNGLVDFLSSIDDANDFLLASLTVGRICLDTYLIQNEYAPYPRKVLFFNLLDKYSNLVRFPARKEDHKEETRIWKNLVKITTYETKLRPCLQALPYGFRQDAKSIVKETIATVIGEGYQRGIRPRVREDVAAELLRAHRNSGHGFFLDEKTRLVIMRHSGDIPNFLPDLAVTLWYCFVANPSKFMHALAS